MKVLILIIWIFLYKSVFPQLNFQRDDFVGTTTRNWWKWHNDGPSTPVPAVNDGYVLFSLVDPIQNFDPYCDAALWDGYPNVGGPYLYGTVIVRAKAMNPHKEGSRGWGFWYTEDPPSVQKHIWFMRQKDIEIPDETWWRAETSYGINEATHHFTDLDSLQNPIDDEVWHTYKITWSAASAVMEIDGDTVLSTTTDIPDQAMAFHIWVDNLVYDYVQPGTINVYKQEWTGNNDIVLDFVQIVLEGNRIDSSETPSGIKLLREIPNQMGTGGTQYLWKQYSFNSPGGKTAFLFTGRVEQYLDSGNSPISDDDDMRVVIDGTDYGWDTSTSFNGDAQGTTDKTLFIEQTLTTGTKSLNIYGDITPLLYDVTVIGSSNGGVIYNQEFNETAPGGTDYLWKTINFLAHSGEIAIYISGTADEDPSPTNYGYQYSNFDDNQDDDLRIVLDGVDYGYKSVHSFWGNRLFGEPKSILITKNLSQGSHTLQLYANNTPTLYRVLIYGENDDVPLPVTLSSFEVSVLPKSNLIQWQTESELNNLGFNIYKAASRTDKSNDELNFFQLNIDLIPGAGNSNEPHSYSFEDRFVQDGWYYWYKLEDVDFNGNTKEHRTVKVYRGEQTIKTLKLLSNYPNPFNASTTIPFVVPEKEMVVLEIFGSSGQFVRRLANKVFEKGYYEVKWDGVDMNGRPVSSGVYYARLLSAQNISVRKMVVLK